MVELENIDQQFTSGGEYRMLNPDLIRSHFPSLSTEAIYLDNPAGTQIVQQALQRLQHYFLHSNANSGRAFLTSRQSDSMVEETRTALADFFNAASPDEIVFGSSMTSLTFNISRSLAHILNPGDEVVVTRLDHDANITPWRLIA